MTDQHTDAAPAHQRTLIAVARVHADAIHSLHTRTASRLDDHSARLLRVLDEELARVLQRLAETCNTSGSETPPADTSPREPSAATASLDGPSVAECAKADRAHWTDKYAGE